MYIDFSTIAVLVAMVIFISLLFQEEAKVKSKYNLNKIKEYWNNARVEDKEVANKSRITLIIFVASMEILLLIIASIIVTKYPDIKRMFSWLKPASTILIPAPVLYLIWSWRDLDKQREQARQDKLAENNQRQLEHAQRELSLNEEQKKWITFLEHLKTIANDKENEYIRAASVYSLKEYFNQNESLKYPQVAFYFLKDFINNWVDNRYKIIVESIYNISMKNDTLETSASRVKMLYLNKDYDKCNRIKEMAEPLRSKISPCIKACHETVIELISDNNCNFQLFPYANIIFDFADMRNISLKNAKLTNMSINHSTLPLMGLPGKDLCQLQVTNSNISSTDFSDSDLTEAHINSAFAMNADFSNAGLYGTDFSESILSHAKFKRAIFKDTFLDGADISHAIFDDAVLLSTNLSKVINYTNASFKNAIYSQRNNKYEILASDNSNQTEIVDYYRYFNEKSVHTIFPQDFDPSNYGMINIWNLDDNQILTILNKFEFT